MSNNLTHNDIMRILATTLLIKFLFIISISVYAESVEIKVTDQQDKPVKDVVISLTNKNVDINNLNQDAPKNAIMDQQNKQYVPHVLPIQTGTSVNFPNSDNIRHHVYSFSKPKPFKLALYSGEKHQPIVFDKSGEVVLGCNIHDRMIGYIYIVDTPYFSKSLDDGQIKFQNIPQGNYLLEIWHPNIANKESVKHQLNLNENKNLSYSINVGKELSDKKAKELSPLEKKFRKIGEK